MLTHSQIWAAVDNLAERHRLSPSGLAKRAGLDATTFNKSKRITPSGKKRWPSTESLSKILEATGSSLDDFLALTRSGSQGSRRIPIIGMAEAGDGGFFDDAGFPAGSGWDEVIFPDMNDEHGYALEISGDSMEPIYREGDRIIVSPGADIRRGDRVVVRTNDGEVLAKILFRRTASHVELHSVNPAYAPRIIDADKIAWIARIIWASQ